LFQSCKKEVKSYIKRWETAMKQVFIGDNSRLVAHLSIFKPAIMAICKEGIYFVVRLVIKRKKELEK